MGQEKRVGTVLVVGAGIAGIKAALVLAESGYKVLLTDASPQIGGILAKLDHQFPTDHCGMCRMLPMVGREYASQHCMRKGLFHDHIEIRPFTEVKAIRGDAGAFEVDLVTRARHVDLDLCNGLGKCVEVCPLEVPDEFNHGQTRRKAIYSPVPHNVPRMFLVDMQACNRCSECVQVCPTNAIDLEARDETTRAEVDAIILAAGTTLYDPAVQDDAKGYTVSEDVVSALAFERLLSASGRYDGSIRRPFDGKPAKRFAWLQCMGSRNRRQERDYCSSIVTVHGNAIMPVFHAPAWVWLESHHHPARIMQLRSDAGCQHTESTEHRTPDAERLINRGCIAVNGYRPSAACSP